MHSGDWSGRLRRKPLIGSLVAACVGFLLFSSAGVSALLIDTGVRHDATVRSGSPYATSADTVGTGIGAAAFFFIGAAAVIRGVRMRQRKHAWHALRPVGASAMSAGTPQLPADASRPVSFQARKPSRADAVSPGTSSGT